MEATYTRQGNSTKSPPMRKRPWHLRSWVFSRNADSEISSCSFKVGKEQKSWIRQAVTFEVIWDNQTVFPLIMLLKLWSIQISMSITRRRGRESIPKSTPWRKSLRNSVWTKMSPTLLVRVETFDSDLYECTTCSIAIHFCMFAILPTTPLSPFFCHRSPSLPSVILRLPHILFVPLPSL